MSEELINAVAIRWHSQLQGCDDNLRALGLLKAALRDALSRPAPAPVAVPELSRGQLMDMAWNLSAEFGPEFTESNEKFAMAVIREYRNQAATVAVAHLAGTDEAIRLLRLLQGNLAGDRDMCDEHEGELWDRIEAACKSLAAAPSAPASQTEAQVERLREALLESSAQAYKAFSDHGIKYPNFSFDKYAALAAQEKNDVLK